MKIGQKTRIGVIALLTIESDYASHAGLHCSIRTSVKDFEQSRFLLEMKDNSGSMSFKLLFLEPCLMHPRILESVPCPINHYEKA